MVKTVNIICKLFAFIISPAAGLFVYQLLFNLHLIFPLSDRWDVSYKYFFIGIDTIYLLYIYALVFGVIVFPIMSFVFKESLLRDLGSSGIVVLIILVNYIFGGVEIRHFDEMLWTFVIAITFGTFTYGVTYHLISSVGNNINRGQTEPPLV